MGRKPSLTTSEIARIEAYHHQGLSNRAIAKKIDRSPKVINNFLKAPAEYRKKYKGNTNGKLSHQDKQKIIHLASNSSMSLKKIGAEAGVDVSKVTISSVIKASGKLKRRKLEKITRKVKSPQSAKDHMSLVVKEVRP